MLSSNLQILSKYKRPTNWTFRLQQSRDAQAHKRGKNDEATKSQNFVTNKISKEISVKISNASWKKFSCAKGIKFDEEAHEPTVGSITSKENAFNVSPCDSRYEGDDA